MQKSTLLNGLLTTTLVAGVLFWAVGVLANSDPLWFSHTFDDNVTSLVVYWDGEVYELTSEDRGFQEIVSAFVDGIVNLNGYEGQVVLSEANLKRYHSEWRLLEVNYAAPVQVHTRYSFPAVPTYLVPLNHTHAYYRRIFGFHHTVPWCAASINMDAERFGTLTQVVESAIASHQ
jgi:hypothetical protein